MCVPSGCFAIIANTKLVATYTSIHKFDVYFLVYKSLSFGKPLFGIEATLNLCKNIYPVRPYLYERRCINFVAPVTPSICSSCHRGAGVLPSP